MAAERKFIAFRGLASLLAAAIVLAAFPGAGFARRHAVQSRLGSRSPSVFLRQALLDALARPDFRAGPEEAVSFSEKGESFSIVPVKAEDPWTDPEIDREGVETLLESLGSWRGNREEISPSARKFEGGDRKARSDVSDLIVRDGIEWDEAALQPFVDERGDAFTSREMLRLVSRELAKSPEIRRGQAGPDALRAFAQKVLGSLPETYWSFGNPRSVPDPEPLPAEKRLHADLDHLRGEWSDPMRAFAESLPPTARRDLFGAHPGLLDELLRYRRFEGPGRNPYEPDAAGDLLALELEDRGWTGEDFSTLSYPAKIRVVREALEAASSRAEEESSFWVRESRSPVQPVDRAVSVGKNLELARQWLTPLLRTEGRRELTSALTRTRAGVRTAKRLRIRGGEPQALSEGQAFGLRSRYLVRWRRAARYHDPVVQEPEAFLSELERADRDGLWAIFDRYFGEAARQNRIRFAFGEFLRAGLFSFLNPFERVARRTVLAEMREASLLPEEQIEKFFLKQASRIEKAFFENREDGSAKQEPRRLEGPSRIVGFFPGMRSRKAYENTGSALWDTGIESVRDVYRRGAAALAQWRGESARAQDLFFLPENIPEAAEEKSAFLAAGILTHSLAMVAYFEHLMKQEGIAARFESFAGMSWGVLVAAIAGGAVSLKDGFRIARFLLPELFLNQPLGAEERFQTYLVHYRDLESMLDAVRARFGVSVEAYHRVSDEKAYLYAAAKDAPEFRSWLRGRFPSARLKPYRGETDKVFHSWRLAESRRRFDSFLARSGIEFNDSDRDIVANDGQGRIRKAEEIRDAVSALVDAPMESARTASEIESLGPDWVVDLGPDGSGLELLAANGSSVPGASLSHQEPEVFLSRMTQVP